MVDVHDPVPGVLAPGRLRLIRIGVAGGDLPEVEAAQTVERRGEDAAFERLEHQFPLRVSGEAAEVGQLDGAFLAERVVNLIDFMLDLTERLGVAHVVRIHIRLHQQRVVHPQLHIEPEGTVRRKEQTIVCIISCRDMMGDEASQPRDNDTVVLQQEYLNMSVEFYHACKITYFIRKFQEPYLKISCGD